ncbi:MAG: YcaO-like family protein [Eubacteriales bacterium]|nr:YcaO-like family protein [Eubacteriales bacterium]
MSNIRRDKAYKTLPPLETINHAREILNQCDLFTLEQHYRFSATGVACCRVWLGDEDVAELQVGTNGKGMNARYALASAYGELLERLQNGALFPMRQRRFAMQEPVATTPERFRRTMAEQGAELLFQFAPDERWLTPAEAAEACGDVVAEMFGIAERDVPELLARVVEGEKTPCVPFYSVAEKRTRLLPMELLWSVCGTNGMCAGNTPREALIQGVSEILERYAIRLLYEENTPPPIVPPSVFAGTEILKRLEAMREAGMEYEIRDCAMGRNLPVIGLRLIRQDGTQAFHLGADPSPITALERCLTELFQGRPEDNERRYHAGGIGRKPGADADHTQKAHYYGHFTESVSSGFGAWPDCVSEPGEPFAGFAHPISESDEDDFDYLMRLLNGLGRRLFVRDNANLGFPAYIAFIPGLSEIDFVFDMPRMNDLLSWSGLVREQRTLLDLPDADEEALKRLANALKEAEANCLTDEFQPEKWFLARENTPPFARNRHAFAAVLYGCVGLYADAAEQMDEYLNSDASQAAPRLLCIAMREGWKLRDQGEMKESVLAKLSTRYGAELAEAAINWRFRRAEWPVCFDCGHCGIQNTCRFEVLCRRQRRVQERMALNPADQAALQALFEEML